MPVPNSPSNVSSDNFSATPPQYPDVPEDASASAPSGIMATSIVLSRINQILPLMMDSLTEVSELIHNTDSQSDHHEFIRSNSVDNFITPDIDDEFSTSDDEFSTSDDDEFSTSDNEELIASDMNHYDDEGDTLRARYPVRFAEDDMDLETLEKTLLDAVEEVLDIWDRTTVEHDYLLRRQALEQELQDIMTGTQQ